MNYFVKMMSGETGISVKRNVLVFLVLLFAYIIIQNMHTGKSPSASLLEQLHELLNLAFIGVFGEKLVNAAGTRLTKKLEDPKTEVKP